MSRVSTNLVWCRRGSLACVQSSDRAVVLDLDRLSAPPRIFEGSAATIWATIEAPCTTEDVVTALAQAFGIDSKDIESDVADFLEQLSREKLVVTEGG